MIEDIELTIKMSLESHMSGQFDLILFSRKFEKEEIFHITVEYGDIITKKHSSIEAFRDDQWIDEAADLDEYFDFAADDDQILKLIKAKYPDVQRVAYMNH